ncbi:MAG: aspartate/glutamate racemase family protein, partial [Terracidiphilus sp.]
ELWLAANQPGIPSTPEISIESLDLGKTLSYIGEEGNEESWARFDDYHRRALERLQASGAEVALIASNTPHHRFKAIVRGIRIPVVSIFEAAAKESARIRAGEVLILGTEWTMNSIVFRQEFSRCGVNAFGPDNEAARIKTAELIGELQQGRIEGAASRLAVIVKASMRNQFQKHSVVCLACTELPLAFPEFKTLSVFDYEGMSFINTTSAHINAVLECAGIATARR